MIVENKTADGNVLPLPLSTNVRSIHLGVCLPALGPVTLDASDPEITILPRRLRSSLRVGFWVHLGPSDRPGPGQSEISILLEVFCCSAAKDWPGRNGPTGVRPFLGCQRPLISD